MAVVSLFLTLTLSLGCHLLVRWALLILPMPGGLWDSPETAPWFSWPAPQSKPGLVPAEWMAVPWFCFCCPVLPSPPSTTTLAFVQKSTLQVILIGQSWVLGYDFHSDCPACSKGS